MSIMVVEPSRTSRYARLTRANPPPKHGEPRPLISAPNALTPSPSPHPHLPQVPSLLPMAHSTLSRPISAWSVGMQRSSLTPLRCSTVIHSAPLRVQPPTCPLRPASPGTTAFPECRRCHSDKHSSPRQLPSHMDPPRDTFEPKSRGASLRAVSSGHVPARAPGARSDRARPHLARVSLGGTIGLSNATSSSTGAMHLHRLPRAMDAEPG